MKKSYGILLIFTALMIFAVGCSDSSSNHPMLKKAAQSKRMGEYRNAELCYKKYLAKNPDAAKIHLELAELYDEHLEEYLLAVYHYKEYLRLTDDSDNSDAKAVKGFISRCEQRYLAKGKSVKKVLMTDEEELERMASAYRKKLADEEKAMAIELERLKKEAEEAKKAEEKVEKTEVSEAKKIEDVKTAPEQTVPAEEAKNTVIENAVPHSVSEVQKSDSQIDATKTVPDTAAHNTEKKEEQKKAEVAVDKDNKTTKTTESVAKQPEIIKDFSALPTMKEQKKTDSVKEVKKQEIKEYKVQKGDTFTHLSRKFYGTVRYHKQLMEYNKISKPNALRVGKMIKIPPVEILKGGKNAK